MKRAQLERFLNGKMAFSVKENKRHTDYTPVLDGKIVSLPKLVRLTRSSREVPRNNIDGVARVLNFNHSELAKGVKCTISAATGYFSLCVAMMFFIQNYATRYPDLLDDFLHPMEASVDLLLDHATALWLANKSSRDDYAKLHKILDQLKLMQQNNHGECIKVAERIRRSVISALEMGQA